MAVRGDSLRDFYAKTLALLGLGVLAGAGALVDYWPARLTLFAPTPLRLQMPAPAVPLADVTLTETPASGPLLARAVVHRPSPVTQAPATPDLHSASPESGLETPDRPDFTLPAASVVTQVSREIPAGIESDFLALGFPDEGLHGASSPEALLVDAGSADTATSGLVRASLAAVGGNDGGDGLITGAFKKTGSSIVKTGARTGASIFDAMRVVSGVVRRALPTD
jgi:hypothetical protein